jgi:hypothetical protein
MSVTLNHAQDLPAAKFLDRPQSTPAATRREAKVCLRACHVSSQPLDCRRRRPDTTSAKGDSTPVGNCGWLWYEKPGELIVDHFAVRPDREV